MQEVFVNLSCRGANIIFATEEDMMAKNTANNIKSSSLSERAFKAYRNRSKREKLRYNLNQMRFIDLLNRRYLRGNGKSLLEAACGRGELAAILQRRYDVTAFDLDKKSLSSAKKIANGAKIFLGDMTKLRLARKFDIIICFDAIDHGKRLVSHMDSVIKSMYAHLNEKGLFIFDLPIAAELWKNDRVNSKTFSKGNTHYVFLYHGYVHKGEFRSDKVTLAIKGNRVESEFKNYTAHDAPMEARHVIAMAKRAGFETRVYEEWREKYWDQASKNTPIVVCLKR